MNLGWIIALSLVGVGAVCLLYGFFIEPLWIKTRTIDIDVAPDLPYAGMTIVYFSDIHVGKTSKRRLDRQIETLRRARGDAILFGGDLVEEFTPIDDTAFTRRIVEALSSLEAPHGKWAVYGNHELEAPRFARWATEVLTASGFTLLRNEGTVLNGLPVWGLTSSLHDDLAFPPDPEAAPLTLLLAHEPEAVADDLPIEGRTVVLSGHAHGGQVTLFGLPLMLPMGARRHWKRKSRLSPNHTLYVSHGLGTVHIHARFFARPDILLVRFVPKA
jgi:predicted MPP superfamily phosphohydrolase